MIRFDIFKNHNTCNMEKKLEEMRESKTEGH